MELLAPIFAVAGALAAGVPLVLHMLRRAPTQRLPFSLVRFLNPARPKLTRRSTIDHWPLLLLRILALVLLGLAFARPFQRTSDLVADNNRNGRQVAILIDRSASMRRTGLQEAVHREVRQAVGNLAENDQLTVALFSSSAETQINAESWATFSAGEKKAAIDRMLTEYAPDWHATKTGTALEQMAEQMRQRSELAESEIVLITDFQEGSDFATLPSAGWSDDITVTLRIVRPAETGNASLHTFTDRRTGRLHLRIANSLDSRTSELRLQPLDGSGMSTGEAVVTEVAPGNQKSLPLESLAAGGEPAELILVGDSHDFDNRIMLPARSPHVSRIAHAGSTDANDPEHMRYYLQRAFDGLLTNSDAPNPNGGPDIVDVVTADGIVLPVPDDVRLAVLTDTVPGELIESLGGLLDRGGVVVAALNSKAMAQSIVELLTDGIQFREAAVDDYAMLGRIDFEHPLFAGFSDARFADFSSIRFWKYRSIEFGSASDDEPDRPALWNIVARFDSGEPAVVRFRKESGDVYVLASGWHPEDSQWALSSRFAPMLAGFLRLASPVEAEHLHRRIGETFRPAELLASTDWAMEHPDGTTLTSAEWGEFASITIDQPGRYILHGPRDDESRGVTILAELDSAESRTVSLPQGQLYSLGLAGHDSRSAEQPDRSSAGSSRPVTAEQLESRQKYWRWFLLAGLCCLAAEAVLAAVIHRRQPEPA